MEIAMVLVSLLIAQLFLRQKKKALSFIPDFIRSLRSSFKMPVGLPWLVVTGPSAAAASFVPAFASSSPAQRNDEIDNLIRKFLEARDWRVRSEVAYTLGVIAERAVHGEVRYEKAPGNF